MSCCGCDQLVASLERIFTEKRRGIRGTCCEYFSHFIILGILILGYFQSEITPYAPKDYSTVQLSLTSGTDPFELYTNLISGPLFTPSLNQYLQVGNFLSDQASSVAAIASQTSYGRSFTNLLYPGAMHFAPNKPVTRNLINYLNETYSEFKRLVIYIHDSENEGIDFILNNLDDQALAFIVIREISHKKVNYVIRQNYTTLPGSNDIIIAPAIGLQPDYQKYLLSGFLSIQKAVDEWIFQYTNVTQVDDPVCSKGIPNFFYTPYPTYSYEQNLFYSAVGFLLGLAMIMSTMYPMSKLTKSIVEEKETRMRELMKIMGLRDWVYNGAWFLNGFILFFWIAVSSSFLTTQSFLVSSNSFLIFVFFFLFCISEINFAFLVSVFFSNSKLAAIFGPVILFATILPRYIFYTTTANEVVVYKILACFLSPTAFAFGADIISNYEYGGVGVQFSNINNGDFNFGTVLVMLWLDFYIYGFLAWYLDKIIPHEMGTHYPPYFIVTPKYWMDCFRCFYCCFMNEDVDDFQLLTDLPEFNAEECEKNTGLEFIPAELRHLAKIRIKNLGKRYEDGKVAVHNFSLSMLEGQITCLLGHNGAGKTTTISTLTGMIEPTAGDALIYGHLLTNDLQAIRNITGLCPQQNVLFPMLTVYEHLRFFGRLKGLYSHKLRAAIDKVLTDVGLYEKKFTLSSALSGGMKRKLCLAISLIGDPKFVLLDEPTSGMDVYSRRSTWELLQRSKAGRVILLTTHFMDEAETLSDRIAIMSEGTLLCAGSSLFLKSRFGIGYMLSISKANSDIPLEPLKDAITSIIDEATIKSAVAGEVIFTLPISTVAKFGPLFQLLKIHSKDLGIGSFGISLTNLEQVFISLAHTKLANDDGLIHDRHQQIVDLLHSFYKSVRSCCQANSQVTPEHSFHAVPQIAAQSSADDQKLRQQQELALPLQQQSLSDIEMQLHSAKATDNINTQTISRDIPIEGRRIPSPSAPKPSQVQPYIVPETLGKDQEQHDEEHSDKGSNLSASHVQPSIDSSTNSSEDSGIAKGNVFIQFKELYKKRLFIAKRDLKGFFFQIVFPAVQIFLILLILTINLNPAGHTIKLNGDMYERYGRVSANVLLAGNYNNSPYGIQEMTYTGDFTMTPIVNASNSEELSNYILNLDTFASDRYGGYVYDDRIPVNVTLDWNLIKDAVTAVTGSTSSNVISKGIEIIAVDYIGVGTTFSLGNIQFLNQTTVKVNMTQFIPIITTTVEDIGLIMEDFLFPNVSTFTITIPPINFANYPGDTITINITMMEKTITTTINTQIIQFISLIPQNLEVPIPTTPADLTATIENNGIRVTASIPLIPGQTTSILLPWTAFNLAFLEPFLPNGIQSYLLHFPNPVTIFHNSSSPHGIVAWQGEMVQALYQHCSSKYVEANPQYLKPSSSVSSLSLLLPEDIQYLIKNHPLPITPQQTLEIRVILSLLAAIFILVPLCYIPAAFVAFIVRERVSKSKHLQLVSGVSPYLYWVATYLWDMTLFLILIGCIMIALGIQGKQNAGAFIGSRQSSLCIITLLVAYGAASLPLSYLYSFAFVNYSTAQIAIMVINFMTGFVMVLAYYIMFAIPNTKEAAVILVHFFRFFPPYNIGEGLINLSTSYFQSKLLGKNINLFAWDVTGRNLVFLLAESIGYFGIVLLTEFTPLHHYSYEFLKFLGILAIIQPPPPERDDKQTDPDILHEEETVRSLLSMARGGEDGAVTIDGGEGDNEEGSNRSTISQVLIQKKVALLLDSLVKTYPSPLGILGCGKPKFAVKGLSLACYEGERFGLLGINGAGKTTTLGVLTREINATNGSVFIGGKSLIDPKTQRMIGYCPQVDPILELMTCYETLWFFGKIRGIDDRLLAARITDLINDTDLTPYRDTPCGRLSGGNKRKLSLAVALIGNPKVLLLDEPSTGMDPQARRHMWNVIERISGNRTIILVSHSMEEIEALCTRVGVMVAGRMHCIGTNQHLKSKYGGGYLIEIRCEQESQLADCLTFCQEIALTNEEIELGGEGEGEESRDQATISHQSTPFHIELEEKHGSYFRLKVSRGLNLSKAFQELEANKIRLHIRDYNISQFSLEQVFINLAKEHENEIEHDDGTQPNHHPHPSQQQQRVPIINTGINIDSDRNVPDGRQYQPIHPQDDSFRQQPPPPNSPQSSPRPSIHGAGGKKKTVRWSDGHSAVEYDDDTVEFRL